MNKLKLLFTISFFLTISVLFSQKSEKITNTLLSKIENTGIENNYTVWIFFKDKGENINQKLTIAENSISKHALERRKKLLKNKPLVDYYDIAVENNYINQITPFLLKLRHQSKWLNAISAEVNSSQLENIASFNFVKKIDIVRKGKYNKDFIRKTKIENSNFVKNAKYNLNYGSSLTQNEQINVPVVHDLGYNGTGLIICVMDAGFNNLEHPAFNSMNIINQWDFVNNDNNVDDEGDMGTGNHGTNTLSTIGGFYEGQLIGPAYGATYLLAKTENTDSETQVEEDNWVAAAEWAEALGADITSTSLGYIDFDDGSGYSASELDGNTAIITIAADIAASKGILVVNSAGNEGGGTTTIGAPADGDSVLAVGAVYSDGSRTSFSSVGPSGDGRIKPEVMAMGSGVVVAESGSGSGYTTASGTSFSCPLTAGAAALLWEMVPNASNMEIFEALKMTANNAETPNNEYGWGIINVYAAYEYLALPQISHDPLSDSEDFNGPYTVTVEVSSNYDMVSESPKLFYRIDNGSWTEVIMESPKENYSYSAEIPGTGSSADYDYYITAENVNALITSPENAPTSFYSFSVAPDFEAPQISHNSIAEYYKNLWGQAKVIAELTDNMGIDVDNSFVEWKINGTSQSNINFSNSEENIYTAYFPYSNLSLGDLIEYKIVAQDISDAQNISTFPVSGFQSFNITDRISFEQNQFSHNWTFTGNENWFVSSDQHQNGSYSAKSGNIDDGEISSISIDFACDDNGTISFYKKVSSENGWDFLNFYINDNLQDEWSGESNWSEETYNVNAGSYTLKWEYNKDGSVSNGSDCAWIDNITLPGITLTYSVTFNVSDGTNPIENANVNFKSQDILTNTSGQAVFSNIAPANNLDYTVTKTGFNNYTGSLSVSNQDVNVDVLMTSSVKIDKLDESVIAIYPNPANDVIFFKPKHDNKNLNIIFYDYTGKIIKDIISFQNITSVNISDINEGIYLCKIKTEDTVEFRKIIITN